MTLLQLCFWSKSLLVEALTGICCTTSADLTVYIYFWTYFWPYNRFKPVSRWSKGGYPVKLKNTIFWPKKAILEVFRGYRFQICMKNSHTVLITSFWCAAQDGVKILALKLKERLPGENSEKSPNKLPKMRATAVFHDFWAREAITWHNLRIWALVRALVNTSARSERSREAFTASARRERSPNFAVGALWLFLNIDISALGARGERSRAPTSAWVPLASARSAIALLQRSSARSAIAMAAQIFSFAKISFKPTSSCDNDTQENIS